MPDYIFTVYTENLVGSDCFKDASKDELRILLAIISAGDEAISLTGISEIANVSVARTKSAITLFEECGIVEKHECESGLADVIYEFANKQKGSDSVASSALETAKSIRDNDLYELQRECEKLLGKSLSTYEIGNLTSLYVDNGLSPQYILLLAAHLTETRSAVKISTIARVARDLVNTGVDTLEDLERYIIEKSKEVKGEAEMRRLLGIHERALTSTERKYFQRWLHELCYASTIIEEAYDICVASTGKRSLQFMDKVLTAWHESGCRTVDECRIQHEQHKEYNKQKNDKVKKPPKKIEAETPKYAEFDSEDALMRALQRSYGDSDDIK